MRQNSRYLKAARAMEKSKTTCNLKWLYRHLDGELGPQENSLAQRHLEQCPFCRKALSDNQALASLFRAKIDDELSRVNLPAIETRVVTAIEAQRIPWWSRLGNLLISKRFYIPATAVVAGLVLLGIFLTPSPSVSGPSAIITSLKGDVGSVMILETPKSHQTVIWFNEPVPPNGQNGKSGPEGSAILGFPAQPIHLA